MHWFVLFILCAKGAAGQLPSAPYDTSYTMNSSDTAYLTDAPASHDTSYPIYPSYTDNYYFTDTTTSYDTSYPMNPSYTDDYFTDTTTSYDPSYSINPSYTDNYFTDTTTSYETSFSMYPSNTDDFFTDTPTSYDTSYSLYPSNTDDLFTDTISSYDTSYSMYPSNTDDFFTDTTTSYDTSYPMYPSNTDDFFTDTTTSYDTSYTSDFFTDTTTSYDTSYTSDFFTDTTAFSDTLYTSFSEYLSDTVAPYDTSYTIDSTFSEDYFTESFSYVTESFSYVTGTINPSSASLFISSSMYSSYFDAPEDITGLNVTFTVGVVEIGNVPKLALYCNFDTLPDYEYAIEWRADDVNVYNSGRLSQSEADAFFVTRDDLDVSGFVLEKYYKCSVKVYYQGGADILLTVFSEEKRAVEFSTTELEMQRGKNTNFTINIDIPLPCPVGTECYVDIKLYDPDEYHNCYDSGLAFINNYTCGQRIFGSSNYSEKVGDQLIIVTTKNNQYYQLKDSFRFHISFEVKGQVEDWWAGTFTQEFTVTVTDDDVWKWAYCYATNDPRMRSFEGAYFNLFETGEFVMYEHTEYQAEVQVATEYCMWAGTCACGISVRAGKDVFVIDHCADMHFTNFTHYSGNGNLYVVQYWANDYIIYLPHGTMVYVGVSPRSWFPFTMLNIFIFPSPSDVNMVKGLCGTLNGNTFDDFTHRDGTTSTVTYGWFWWPWWQTSDPSDFIESWRLTSGESLWNTDLATEDLEDWTEDSKCVCTGSEGTGSAVCSNQEKRLCVNQGYYSGVEITRRSADRRRSKVRKAREVQGHILDKRSIQRRLKIREERRSANTLTRTKRQAEPSVTCDFETAYNICVSSMTNKCGSLLSEDTSSTTGNNTDKIIACALDKQLNCTVNWEDSSCSATLTTVQETLDKDTSLDEATVSAIEDDLCPNFCCGNGDCNSGTCSCKENYATEDCGLDTRDPVEILDLGGSTCTKPCLSLSLVLSGVIDGAISKIRHKKVSIPGNIVEDLGYFEVPLQFYNLYEGSISLPSQRKRRSVSNGSSEAADIYEISVSNDGSSFGSSSPVVTLDTTCLTYTGSGDNITITLTAGYCLIEGVCYQNGVNNTEQTCNYCDVNTDTFGWTLESGFCLIDDVCYANGTAKSGNTCKYCHVSLDSSDWTEDNETASCLETESADDSGMKGYVIAIIVLAVLLATAAIAVLGYFVWKKYQASRLRKRGLFDSVGKSKFLLRVEPSKTTLGDLEGLSSPMWQMNQASSKLSTKWTTTSGQHDTIRKPKFVLQAEPTMLAGPGNFPPPNLNTSGPQQDKDNLDKGINRSVAGARFVLPTETPEDLTADHPPPNMYRIFDTPEPGTEKMPSNLYTENGSGSRDGAPNMYRIFDKPEPGMEKTPSNLYIENDSGSRNGVPSPIEPERSSSRLSTGHSPQESDTGRASTPNMPTIE